MAQAAEVACDTSHPRRAIIATHVLIISGGTRPYAHVQAMNEYYYTLSRKYGFAHGIIIIIIIIHYRGILILRENSFVRNAIPRGKLNPSREFPREIFLREIFNSSREFP